MEEPTIFYRSFFKTEEDTRAFVKSCDTNKKAKIILHQTIRLVSLSDEVPKLELGDEPLQLLFLIMCAENIAKLHAGFRGKGQFRKHVRMFFKKFLTSADKKKLGESFINNSANATPRESLKPLEFDKAVDLLYEIRCDVVHEGNYWGFSFHNGMYGFVNTNPEVIAEMQLVEIRNMVVRAAIAAIQRIA